MRVPVNRSLKSVCNDLSDCWMPILFCFNFISSSSPNNAHGDQFNIKMTSYHSRKSHCGDKTILRPSYLYNGISYSGKMTSLYWISALVTIGTQREYFIISNLIHWDLVANTCVDNEPDDPSLVEMMVFRMFGTKHLFKPRLVYW